MTVGPPSSASTWPRRPYRERGPQRSTPLPRSNGCRCAGASALPLPLERAQLGDRLVRQRRAAAGQAVANVVVGDRVAVLVQMALFPLFGIAATLVRNLAIGLVFTAVSIVRSYLL